MKRAKTFPSAEEIARCWEEELELPPFDVPAVVFLGTTASILSSKTAAYLDVEIYSATFKETSRLRITLLDKPETH